MLINTTQPTGLGFDPGIQERLRELFRDRTCARCTAPATRLRTERFYCDAHFPRARREAPPPRVYRLLMD